MKQPMILIALTLGTIQAAVQAPAQNVLEQEMSIKERATLRPRVTVSSVENPRAKGRRFSVARSTDLTFRVRFNRSLDGDHVVTLKVFTPNGHIYRQYDVPVASGMTKRSETARQLPGYPYPVPVQTTNKTNTTKAGGRNSESIDVSFPVAGSTIVTSSLYGRWRVEVYLDGAVEPIGKRTFFHLRE